MTPVTEPDASLAVVAMREGLLALRDERWVEAEAALRRAAELGDGWPDALAYLSGVLLSLGRPVEAQDAIDSALASDPNGFAAQLKGGEMSLRLGDPVTAEERFLGALRVSVPGSSAEAAAKVRLQAARTARRRGIEHTASLPWGPRVFRRFRSQATGAAHPSETAQG